MIKYKLICKSCKKNFDSWFSSSKEYDKLKKLKLINCVFCNSLNVMKSLMAPNIINNPRKNNKFKKEEKKLRLLKNKIMEYQKFIKNNLEFVGENFAYEARSIHYNSKKKNKGIYGKATIKQVKELSDEGIETQTIPWIEEKKTKSFEISYIIHSIIFIYIPSLV